MDCRPTLIPNRTAGLRRYPPFDGPVSNPRIVTRKADLRVGRDHGVRKHSGPGIARSPLLSIESFAGARGLDAAPYSENRRTTSRHRHLVGEVRAGICKWR